MPILYHNIPSTIWDRWCGTLQIMSCFCPSLHFSLPINHVQGSHNILVQKPIDLTGFDHSEVNFTCILFTAKLIIYTHFIWCFCLLHLPPALHPFILADVPCKHLPPPLLQHVGEWQCGHNSERLFQQKVDLCVCKSINTDTVYD